MNNIKQLQLHDNITNLCKEDTKFVKGHVVAYVEGTDTVLFEKWNKVILPGSTFTAMKFFKDLQIGEMTYTYNQKLGLDNSTSVASETERKESYIFLFAVGVGGCGSEASQVNDVDYTKWIAPADLVPFRYPNIDQDITVDLRNKYFGRKVIGANNKIAYYFKGFDEVRFKQQYLDGTPIDSNVYESSNSTQAETYVEIKMTISNKDCREYFASHTGLQDAKINTISLLSAVETEIDGIKYYQNIRPVTKLNFPTEQLVDETKGIDIVYSLFF